MPGGPGFAAAISLLREALTSFFERRPVGGYLFMRNLAGVIGQCLHAMQDIRLHDFHAGAIRELELPV